MAAAAIGAAVAGPLSKAAINPAISQLEDTGSFIKNVFSGHSFFGSLGNWYQDTIGNISNIASNTIGIGDIYHANDTSQMNRSPVGVNPQPIITHPINDTSGTKQGISTVNMRQFNRGPELMPISSNLTDIHKSYQDALRLRGLPPQNMNIYGQPFLPIPQAQPQEPLGLSALAPTPKAFIDPQDAAVPEPIGPAPLTVKQKRINALKKARAARKKKGGKAGKKKGGKKKKVRIT